MSILVVEPDRSLSYAIERFMAARDINCVSSVDAQDAIAKADEDKPEAVILELAMPKNNGVAFLQEFRSYTDWLNVPIIIYSRIPQQDTRLTEHDWKKNGVVAYLYKPTCPLSTLQNRLTNLIAK